MYLKTPALVIRISEYNDKDALLTLLTPDHGKITAKARGIRRKNSPLSAVCQLLSFCEMTLFEYRGMYTINEASSIALFLALRKDLSRLSLGTYFAQVGETVSQEDAPSGELLSLILNCLHALSELNLPEAKVKAVFEFRIACIAGYTPDLHSCKCRSGTGPSYFDLSGGCLLCEVCKQYHEGIRLPVENGTIAAMRYITTSDSKKLFSFSVGEGSIRQLSEVAEAYLITHLERGFPTLDFYKSLLI